jgi:hypothetical protein
MILIVCIFLGLMFVVGIGLMFNPTNDLLEGLQFVSFLLGVTVIGVVGMLNML